MTTQGNLRALISNWRLNTHAAMLIVCKERNNPWNSSIQSFRLLTWKHVASPCQLLRVIAKPSGTLLTIHLFILMWSIWMDMKLILVDFALGSFGLSALRMGNFSYAISVLCCNSVCNKRFDIYCNGKFSPSLKVLHR